MTAQRTALTGVLVSGLWLGGCATVAPTIERESSLSSSYSGGRAIQDFARPLATSDRPCARRWKTSR